MNFPRYITSVTFTFFSLALAYVIDVSPIFGEHAFFPLPTNLSFVRFFASFALFLVIVSVVSLSKRHIVDFFTFISITFFLLPISVMSACDYERPFSLLALSGLAVIITHFSPRLTFRSKIRWPVSSAKYRRSILAFAVLVIISYLVLTIMRGSLDLINFDLSKVYTFRRDQEQLIGGAFAGYLSVWVPKILNPFLMIFFATKRKILPLLICIIFQVYFYAISSNRELLFIPLLVLMVYYFFRSSKSYHHLMLYLGVVVLMLIILAQFFEFWRAVNELALRRTFFVPAAAAFTWVDYFSNNPFVFWSDRFLSSFIESQYNGERIPFIVGDFIRTDYDLSANAGLVSSGFANLGTVGVIFYSLILSLVLKAIAALSRLGVPHWIIGALLVNPIRTAWSDSDLITALVSHGIILALILAFLFGKAKKQGSFT